MKLDLQKIQEIYGNNAIKEIKENEESFVSNMKYLKERGFTNLYEIIEQNPYSFLEDEAIFQEKIDHIIKILGVEYIEKLEEDMTLWRLLDE